jgi:mRNA-degrading endonuclease RelE of RelBE toxin-antitoxin system
MQIVFNEISAAELSRLPTQVQFQLLDAMNIQPTDMEPQALVKRFGILERGDQRIYRCRAGDYRIYFGVEGGDVRVLRVLNKNSLKDFLFRTNIASGEDEELAKSKHFWQLLDDGAKTLRVVA